MKSLASKPLLDELNFDLKQKVAALVDADIDPHLAVVLVGDDENSLNYIDIKTKVAKEVGIIVSLYHIEGDVPFEEIEETVKFLGGDEEIHGIIVQLPLPDTFSEEQLGRLLQAIPASKDVDGLRGDWKTLHFSSYSTHSLLANQPYSLPPMVGSVLSLLNHYDIELEEKKIVIVGKGRLVGGPLSEFFAKLGVDVQAVDESTPSILEIAKTADILICGTGEKDLITYQWVKEGATVIDCAEDIHFDSVSQIASALSPSVGGVGPLTVFWLLHNTYLATKNQS